MKATLVLCLHRMHHVPVGRCLCDQQITKDADMEKALLSCDITNKVLVEQRFDSRVATLALQDRVVVVTCYIVSLISKLDILCITS